MHPIQEIQVWKAQSLILRDKVDKFKWRQSLISEWCLVAEKKAHASKLFHASLPLWHYESTNLLKNFYLKWICLVVELDTGEQLVLSNISREQTGVYTCTAFNGVVPFAHRQIKVDVECESLLPYLGSGHYTQNMY